MPPRGFTNPAPKTESAREAVKSFYCNLCSKGYARMNEYEAHLSSYDHSHKQRLKDMKQLTRDVKGRRPDTKEAGGLISIKLGGDAAAAGGAKKGFKKGGFKSAFTVEEKVEGEEAGKQDVGGAEAADVGVESDTEDEGYEMYDPRQPTS